MASRGAPDRSGWWRLGLPLAVFAATVWTFVPALGGGFVWDDAFNVVGNPHLGALAGPDLWWMLTAAHLGHYHPLTWLSLAADQRFHGLEPWGYHLTNVLLHAGNAVLVYALGRALLEEAGAPADRRAAVAAAVGAFAFALHPLRVESVAWVTERRDVLCAFWTLLALLAYLRAGRSGGAGWRAASLAAFACSLLAKAWGITFPVVLLVLDVYPLGRFARLGWMSLLREKVPYAVLAIAAGVMAAVAQRSAGAMVGFTEHGLGARAVQAAYGTAFYLWKTVVPAGLSPLYPLEGFTPTTPAVLAASAAAVALTIAVVAARRTVPALAAAWAVYVLVLAPVLGFAQSGIQVVADRYTYLATIPVAVLIAAGVRRALDSRRPPARIAAWGSLVLVAALAVATRRQIAVWHDEVALWGRATALYPASHDAWHNLGLARAEAGDPRGALGDLNRAVAAGPDFAPAYNTRGTVRESLGDAAGARADYDRAIALVAEWPDPYVNRGNLRLSGGDVAGALADYDRALALQPLHLRAHFNRALARERQRDVAGALADMDAVVALAPEYAQAYAMRVRYRAASGDVPGAFADCERALALLPPDAADAQTVRGYRAELIARFGAPGSGAQR